MGSTVELNTATEYFKDQGWSNAQAAGIVGNLQAESGRKLNPASVGDGGQAYGIAQWHPDRQAKFKEVYGKPIQGSGLQDQLAFVDWELNNSHKNAGNLLRKSNDPGQSAVIVDKYYEVSSGIHRNRRIRYAKDIDNGGPGYPTASTNPPSNNAADAAIANGATLAEANAQGVTTTEFLQAEIRANQNKFNDDDRTLGAVPFNRANNTSYAREIVQFDPRPNPFTVFSTMTYNVSLYMLDQEQYASLMKTTAKNVDNFMLFLQSGGAPVSGTTHGAKRSEYFKNDFYIDDIQFKSMISGTSTMAAHNTFELNFKITEPSGITLFENLTAMVHEETRSKNYAAQQYLMVVRFYGYDENGKQIEGHTLENVSSQNLSDPIAVGEKFIPFMFTGITFRLHNDVVEYSCKAACTQSLISKDAKNGKCKTHFTLSGNTLNDVLNGDDKAGTIGLAQALNQEELDIVKKGNFKLPNLYSVKFEKGVGFENMTVFQSGEKYLPTSGMTKSSDEASHMFLNNKLKLDISTKQLAVTAGTSIIKLIDVIMQTSQYIADQHQKVTDSSSGRVTKKGDVAITERDFKWFKIMTETKQIGWDSERNSFAYEITYTVRVYNFVSESQYVNTLPTECFSIHKEYNYWFTGKNTEVLKFEQDYNYLWYSAIVNDRKKSESRREFENNAATTISYSVETSSTGTNHYGANESTEVSANIASNLYSPSDQAMVKIEIVGDPDFIAQSELFYSPQYILNTKYARSPFLEDGSVNYDTAEIYFSINFNTVLDYDINTGLMDVSSQNVGSNPVTGEPGIAEYALVYRANLMTTTLSKGKFTQEIEGTMKQIQPHCKTSLPSPKQERREDPNKKTIPADLSLNTGDMRLSPVFVGGTLNDATNIQFPGNNTDLANSSLSDENLIQNSNGTVIGNNTDTGVPFLDDYVNQDNNGYIDPNSQAPRQNPNNNVVENFNDYIQPNADDNIIESGLKTGARFTQGVWTDVEGFINGETNEDDR